MTSDNAPEFGRRATPPGGVASSAPVKPAPAAAEPAQTTVRASRRSRASRSQFVVFMNFLMSLAVVAAIGAAAAVWLGKRQFDAVGPTKEAKTFMVNDGAGWALIARQLEAQNLVSDDRVFRLGVQTNGGGVVPKVGEYEIPAGASMRQIMSILQSGKSIMYSLTIPEGLTVQQAWDRIAAAEALTGDMPAEMPPEGSLAADTQRFTRGTERKAIIDKMLADQKALIEEVWAKRAPNLPVADVNEFVTLASIVEKETGVAAERPHVASVFVNRLNQGMRLQSDPTILYGLFGGKGRPADRPIYQSDIQKPTPYNTYTINGLPPGPIANPGRAALEAVANPLDTKDLFFVADGTGGHVFAETLQEHNRNVAKWRAVERARQSGETPAADPKPQE